MQITFSNMKYTIDWMEERTTGTGKKFAKTTLVDANGQTHEEVAIWGDFPSFADLRHGAEVEGDIVVKDNGQYKNKTLYPARQTNGRPSSNPMNKVMEKKAEYIKEAQQRKEDSIAFFNANNSAIALLGVYKVPIEDAKEFIVEWRGWFLDQYESGGKA